MPHLLLKGKSHGFSHFAEGNWGIISSFGGLDFNIRVSSATSSLLSSYDGYLRNIS